MPPSVCYVTATEGGEALAVAIEADDKLFALLSAKDV